MVMCPEFLQKAAGEPKPKPKPTYPLRVDLVDKLADLGRERERKEKAREFRASVRCAE